MNNNLKKAAFDIFGIGAEPEDFAPQSDEGDAVSEPVMAAEEVNDAKIIAASRPQSVADNSATPYGLIPSTYIAPGTVLEGTLRSKGDLEIAGTFKGDIVSEGDVILHTDIEGNVTSNNLYLVDCCVSGDCIVNALVKLDAGSKITGNIYSSELYCSGNIVGEINVKGNSTFTASAVVDANVYAGSVALERGAKLSGRMNVQG